MPHFDGRVEVVEGLRVTVTVKTYAKLWRSRRAQLVTVREAQQLNKGELTEEFHKTYLKDDWVKTHV